jgi:ParB/RepB/Spo0J family partition protein
MTNSVLQVPIANIQPNPKQPRQVFDEAELLQLAASIKEHGVIQPLILCPPNAAGVYVLIAGERRWRAAQLAELETVPAIVRTISTEDDQLVLAVIENVNREDMSPVEEGDAYLQLKNMGWSNTKIAAAVGVNDVRVGHCFNCASLPAATRALIQRSELYTSNKFIAVLKEIADGEPDACDDLATELARACPTLKAAIKSAEGVLAYLRNIKSATKENKTHKIPIFEIASETAKLDLDDNDTQAPPQWDLLLQAGFVPPWNMVAQAARNICSNCELRDIASSVMCSACTAAQMLVSLATLAQVQEA